MKTPKATSSADSERIIPRAEFRIFGQGIIDIVKPAMRKVQSKLLNVYQGHETYILSSRTNATNVKIRDGLLDMKIKLNETKSGYEVFQSRGKFQFPATREKIATILQNLQANVELKKSSYSFDAFLELVQNSTTLTEVDVYKRRYTFSIDGVLCEYAKIQFDGIPCETACVESENYKAMEHVIDKLGISGFENISYLKAAKRVLGMQQPPGSR